MAGGIREFLAREYRRHGPIFRVRAFDRRFIAFAGPETMVFLTKIVNTHLRSCELWRNFNSATGALHVVTGMDGPEHLRKRKMEGRAYSPKSVEARLDDFVDIACRAVAEWPRDRPIACHRAMQEIISEQMGLAFTGMSPREYLDDLIVYLETLLNIHVVRLWPKLMEYRPRFRRARRRMMEMHAALLEAHRPENRGGAAPDFIDELLEMNRQDPQFLPETDYPIAFVEPYLASLNTSASACSYVLHALLKHPELLAQVRAEADAAFDRGSLTAKDIRNLDVTHRVVLETLRMYPIAPAIRRIVSNSFEFQGYEVPAGADVLIGITVGHYLPEFFPDPDRFDIERYRRSPPEHRQPGAYAPFGLGRHRCLGSAFAEMQIALTVATIVHKVELAMERPGRPLKIKQAPHPHPGASFRIRAADRRR